MLARFIAWLDRILNGPQKLAPKLTEVFDMPAKVSLAVAVKRTLGKEGGYSNRKSDRGGETIFGVSRKKNPKWEAWPLVEKYSPRKLAVKDKRILAMAAQLADKRYGRPIGAHLMPDQDILNEVFDTAYNMGPRTAARIFQRSLNYLSVTPRGKKLFRDLKVDGKPGTKTMKACRAILKAGGKDVLLKQLDIFQGGGYVKIIDRDQAARKKGKRKNLPDQRINMWGWLRHRIGLA
jgi:lysozyme family protein